MGGGVSEAAALLDAVEGDGPLPARLEALARRLADLVGAAAVGFELPLGDQRVPVGPWPAGAGAAAPADLADPADLAEVDVGGGVVLRVSPAAALEGARPAVALAGRLARAAVERERAAARAARADDVISAITHDLNNALTPLLCSHDAAVTAAALRLRGLLDTLRHLRGRVRPRELWWLAPWLERARRLLAVTAGGAFPVMLAVDAAAARRAIGPEQDALLPLLVSVGLALRAHALPGAPLELAAGLDDAGRVALRLAARVPSASALGVALDLAPRPGLAPRVAVDGERVEVRLTLERRPRLLVLAGAGPAPEGLAAALADAGIDVEVLGQPDAALRRALEPPEPALVLALPGADAGLQAVRSGLHRALPLLAGRCHALDARLAPRHAQPGPDEVDVGALLAPLAARAAGAPP